MITKDKNIFYTEKGANDVWEQELEAEKAFYQKKIQEQIQLRQAVLSQIALVPDLYVELLYTLLVLLNTQIQQQNIDSEKITLLMNSLQKSTQK